MRAFWDAMEHGAQEVWLDVSGVVEIDEAGAAAIARLGTAAHELNRAVAVICPLGQVHDSLVEYADVPLYGTLSAAHYDG